MVAVVVGVLVIGLSGLYVGWPHYRPSLRDGEAYGLDVSGHQGVIDWQAVAADRIAAAYIKASEGGTMKDQRFAANWNGARAAGLSVGAYHFFTLCRSGHEQADNFLKRWRDVGATPGPGVLPPVVDLELSGNCSARPPRDEVLAELKVFVDEVVAGTDMPVMLYVIDSFEDRYPVPADLARARWVRRLALRPDRDWAWWQVNNRARVHGIGTPVDLNVLRTAPRS
jgi:lysozyme